MSRSVFAKSLWDQRRALLWWSLGILLVVAMYVLPYEQFVAQGVTDISTDGALFAALGMSEMTSPAGYLEGSVFAILMPLLFIIAGVAVGARAVAGDEESGMLDLLLARPLSRRRLVVERFAALTAEFVWLGAFLWVVLALVAPVAGIDVPGGRLAAAVLALALLGLLFGALSLAVGAALGRRVPALAVAAAVGVGGFAANSVAALVDGLGWARLLSPFYYYSGGSPLRAGLQGGHVAVLGATVLVLLAVALATFARRDVAT